MVSRFHDLLWAVLWKPLALRRDIVVSLSLDGKSLELDA